MPTYSNSKLSTFENCPLQYKYKYIDKIELEEEMEPIEFFMGSKVHEALEKLYEGVLNAKTYTVEEIVAFFNKEWKENYNDTIKINKPDFTEENYRIMGERCIIDYYQHYHPFDKGKILGIETQEFLPLDDRFKIHVRIDRLMEAEPGVYEVHDYKTSGRIASQEKVDEDRQLAVYSMWVLKNFPDVKKVRLVWHFLRFDKEMVSERTPEQLEELRKDILVQIECIEREDRFEPNKSPLCNWCEYQEICPLWAHQKKLEKVSVNEYLTDDGVKLVNEYSKAKTEEEEIMEKIDKIKEAIISFTEKEGINVIVGSDKRVQVSERECYSIPQENKEKLKDLLKELGKLEEVSTVNAASLGSKMEKWKEKNYIAPLMKKQKSKTIRLSKKE